MSIDEILASLVDSYTGDDLPGLTDYVDQIKAAANLDNYVAKEDYQAKVSALDKANAYIKDRFKKEVLGVESDTPTENENVGNKLDDEEEDEEDASPDEEPKELEFEDL